LVPPALALATPARTRSTIMPRLELSKYVHHPKHSFAGRRRGVDPLLVQGKVDPKRVQLGEKPN
jgi:hypothetical protein